MVRRQTEAVWVTDRRQFIRTYAIEALFLAIGAYRRCGAIILRPVQRNIPWVGIAAPDVGAKLVPQRSDMVWYLNIEIPGTQYRLLLLWVSPVKYPLDILICWHHKSIIT